jgi:hypothetical protein
MTAPLCFIDTETTSLRPDRRAWEIGIIHRVPVTDSMALKIGRFYERHPQAVAGGPLERRTIDMPVVPEQMAMSELEAVTRDISPSWHYHLIDVEALAVGALSHSAAFGRSSAGSKRELTGSITALPWKSDDLSAALGVTVSDEDRHTALGDARWAMRIYDAVMCGAA